MEDQEMIEIRVDGGREEEPTAAAAAAEMDQNRIINIRREFKQFDFIPTVENDHHYYASSSSLSNHQQTSKKIMKEWKILEKNLPDSIFVRAYESRIDLLRAVIIGAAGTPYHDGLFFFDIKFPSDYPNKPPKVYYHSFGYRLNPNLYDIGYVCLSLLNTWSGDKNEKWNPSESTVLQVLLSIQALVLNSKPYFNEPGRRHLITDTGRWYRASLGYNQDVFVLSCKTMLGLLNRPPKHFEEFVVQHFRDRAENILIACKAYIDGRVRVGGAVTVAANTTTTTTVTTANKFQKTMRIINSKLVKAFIQNGSTSLENYVGENIADNQDDLDETNKPPGATCRCFFGFCLFLVIILVLIMLGLIFSHQNQ